MGAQPWLTVMSLVVWTPASKSTCTCLDSASLQIVPEITAVTMAELHQGVAMAKPPTVRAARTEKLGAAIVEFEPLPFDGEAATRYGTLVALKLSVNRDPRPAAWT